MHYLKPAPRAGLMFGYGRLAPVALREATRLFGECLDVMDARENNVPAWCAAARFAVS